jgi:hypothetical protein
MSKERAAVREENENIDNKEIRNISSVPFSCTLVAARLRILARQPYQKRPTPIQSLF